MTFQAVLLYKNNVHLLYQSDSSIQLHCGIIKINRQCVLNINAGMNMRWTIYLFLLFFKKKMTRRMTTGIHWDATTKKKHEWEVFTSYSSQTWRIQNEQKTYSPLTCNTEWCIYSVHLCFFWEIKPSKSVRKYFSSVFLVPPRQYLENKQTKNSPA